LKKFAIILFSLFLVLLSVTVCFAGSSKTRQITGDVIAIDTKSNTVTVKKKDREVVISIRGKTAITECAPKSSITDIKIGDKVTAKYKKDDNNTAKSIAIRTVSE